jgi:hypothetical protein
MFIVALFTIAKLWNQPRCPSTNEWIKKMCYAYTMECYSAIKRMKLWYLQENGGTGDHHVKQSNSGSERQRSHVLPHMWKVDLKYI